MKKLSIIILALLSVFIISCDKDNKNDRLDRPEKPKADLELTQTYWEGKYIDILNGVTSEYDVRIKFQDEGDEDQYRGGSYAISDFNSEKEYRSEISYNVNGKVLFINDADKELAGYWWKIGGDQDQLILQRRIESTVWTSKLIINRKKFNLNEK